MSEMLMYVRLRIRGGARLVVVCRLMNFTRLEVLVVGLGIHMRVSLQLN
jgi:hypothetical protein